MSTINTADDVHDKLVDSMVDGNHSKQIGDRSYQKYNPKDMHDLFLELAADDLPIRTNVGFKARR